MKRGTFKQKTLVEVRAKQAAKRLKSPAEALKPTKTKKATDPSKKVIQKGYKPPSWFMSIPANGTHGKTANQKRYWRVITNFVRQRDFNKYNQCVSCTDRLERWQDYQGGHFKPFGSCNSFAKFSPLIVHAQCPGCNLALKQSNAAVGHQFAKTLIKRYGQNILKDIEKENLKYQGQKLEDMEIVARVEKLLEENPWFVLP